MKRKSMALCALLLAVMVTSYSVCGTYAKYISSIDYVDEARVAKWDFKNEPEKLVDLFQSSYSTTKDGNTYTYVASKDASKVVAPGTEGEYEYKITGTAETNFKVSKSIKVLNRVAIVGDYYSEQLGLGDWGTEEGDYEKGKIYYNPIEFSIDGGKTWKKATKFEYDENNKFLGLSVEFDASDAVVYPANYVLTNELAGTISWRWAFQTGSNENEQYANDVLDTNLALLAVDNRDMTLNANISVSVVQTQEQATATLETATQKASQRSLVIGNNIPDWYAKDAQKEIGYDSRNNEKVIFTGSALKGTIYKTTNAVADRFNGTNATGYYYPLMFEASAEEGTTITGLHIKSTRFDTDVVNGYGAILPLHADDKANGIVITVKYSDKTTKDFKLDLSELTFATTTNQSR